MRDDYLWDKTGEPDPDIQALEQLLKPLGHKPKPLAERPAKKTQRTWLLLAAAVLLAMVSTVMWRLSQQTPTGIPVAQSPVIEATEVMPADEPTYVWPGFTQEMEAEALAINMAPLSDDSDQEVAFTPVAIPEFYEELPLEPVEEPVLNDVTAAHIERVELLLRSFRNSRGSEDDIAYDRQKARELLMPHTLLRRDAETTGDLAATEILNSLEPYLLDIANIRNQGGDEETEAIKNRMQRQSIMAALQIYGP